MIPGAWEPRPQSMAPGATGAPIDRVYERVKSGRVSAPDAQRAELPSWLKVSIVAAVLIAAMWLAMSVF